MCHVCCARHCCTAQGSTAEVCQQVLSAGFRLSVLCVMSAAQGIAVLHMAALHVFANRQGSTLVRESVLCLLCQALLHYTVPLPGYANRHCWEIPRLSVLSVLCAPGIATLLHMAALLAHANGRCWEVVRLSVMCAIRAALGIATLHMAALYVCMAMSKACQSHCSW